MGNKFGDKGGEGVDNICIKGNKGNKEGIKGNKGKKDIIERGIRRLIGDNSIVLLLSIVTMVGIVW